MNIEHIIVDINEICDFADKYYPPEDIRPAKLRSLAEELADASDDAQRKVKLARIRSFLRGGQGSFHDLSLDPPPDGSMSRGALNDKFGKMLGSLYLQIEEVLR